jgi:hypothetical protein
VVAKDKLEKMTCEIEEGLRARSDNSTNEAGDGDIYHPNRNTNAAASLSESIGRRVLWRESGVKFGELRVVRITAMPELKCRGDEPHQSTVEYETAQCITTRGVALKVGEVAL